MLLVLLVGLMGLVRMLLMGNSLLTWQLLSGPPVPRRLRSWTLAEHCWLQQGATGTGLWTATTAWTRSGSHLPQ